MTEFLATKGPYLIYVLAFALGLYLMLTHRNLLKAVVGLSLVQSSIILFFILLSVRAGATLPIVVPDIPRPVHAPLPHALMLTAIVVGVATQGVAFAILRRIQREHGSIEDRRGAPRG